MAGSRRARRSQGRLASYGGQPSMHLKGGVSKASIRSQKRAALRAVAKTAKQARLHEAPRLIALLPLSEAADAALLGVFQSLNAELNNKTAHCVSIPRAGLTPREWMINALDVCKVADVLSVVFAATEKENGIDDEALEVLSALRAQGLPEVVALAAGPGAADASLRKYRGRQLAAESLGDDADLRPLDVNASAGVSRAARKYTAGKLRELSWRKRYGYMLVENAEAVPNSSEDDTVTLRIRGRMRGAGVDANQLMMLTGFGAFKMSSVSRCDTGQLLSSRDELAGEPVESEAPIDETAGEQTWPPEMDDADMAAEDTVVRKRVPKGFSEYQAAWIPDDADDIAAPVPAGVGALNTKDKSRARDTPPAGFADPAAADDDDDDDNASASGGERSDDDPDRDGGSTMAQDDTQGHDSQEDGNDDGLSDEEDMDIDAEEVARTRAAAREDAEFPDEVDTPIDQPARVRFARYRGLKSLRTSAWDPKEQLPRAYARLFQFADLKSTRKRVLDDAEKRARDNNTVGHVVEVVLLDVDAATARAIQEALSSGKHPVVASGMLKHENRRSVVHFGLQRVDGEDGGIVKAKSALEIHCGFVRFDGRPMFSEQNANSDKHKMERYLIHGRYTVASFYGPAVYSPAPALLFHRNGALIATGSALGADPDRICLKRIVLTGYPFKTQKRRTVVKFMFFSPDDIRWFKPVELWTKLGRTGHIQEPVGTHGRMKCTFDATILHHDTVCMTLYKRVYPKSVTHNVEEDL